jgi:hypothetical protein
MDNLTTPTLRRSEDIALDLLKFVAGHTNMKSASTTGTPGFGVQSPSKSEDQVTQLLDLYARCRQAVEAPAQK